MKQILKNLVNSGKEQAAAQAEQAARTEAEKKPQPVTTKTVTLEIDGELREFIVRRYPATHGLAVVRMIERHIDWMLSNNNIGFRIDAEAHVAVFYGVTAVVEGQEYPLGSVEALNARLSSWQDIEALRREVLEFNMIDEPAIEQKRGLSAWEKAGAELSAGFVAFAAKLLEAQGIYADPKKTAKQ